MRWRAWLGGLISALATTGYLVVTSLGVLEKPPETAWAWFLLVGVPGLKAFFDWLKTHPVPNGGER